MVGVRMNFAQSGLVNGLIVLVKENKILFMGVEKGPEDLTMKEHHGSALVCDLLLKFELD